jgi:hypothetical protein
LLSKNAIFDIEDDFYNKKPIDIYLDHNNGDDEYIVIEIINLLKKIEKTNA